jgi:zinc protease
VTPRNSPDAVRLGVVNNIFGGSFNSRINMNLREDKHWLYGVPSQLQAAVGQRLYMSSSPVQTDKTLEALHELVMEYGYIAGAKPISSRFRPGLPEHTVLIVLKCGMAEAHLAAVDVI